jgi:hypothetical protein
LKIVHKCIHRESELEQAQQIKELEDNWTELNTVIRGIYYTDNLESVSNEDPYELADIDRLHDLIGRYVLLVFSL